MSVSATTHLNFRGEAREALAFYAAAFGGQTTLNTYADFGMPAGLPDSDRVVFGLVSAPTGFSVMAYDVPGSSPSTRPSGTTGSTRRQNGTTVTDEPFFIAVQGGSLDEVSGPWEALAVDATIVEPLAASAWSAGFGMLTDRFGVTWAVSVVTPRD